MPLEPIPWVSICVTRISARNAANGFSPGTSQTNTLLASTEWLQKSTIKRLESVLRKSQTLTRPLQHSWSLV